MKTIYKILLFSFLIQNSLFSQFEVLSIIKPTDATSCDGKINLKFVESELPYVLTWSSSENNGTKIVTSTVYTIPGLCPVELTITAIDNHGCEDEVLIALEKCDIQVKQCM